MTGWWFAEAMDDACEHLLDPARCVECQDVTAPPPSALPQDCPHPEAWRVPLNASGWLYETCAGCASERVTGDDSDDRERPPGDWSPIVTPSHVPAAHLEAAGIARASDDAIEGYLDARYDQWKTATKEKEAA